MALGQYKSLSVHTKYSIPCFLCLMFQQVKRVWYGVFWMDIFVICIARGPFPKIASINKENKLNRIFFFFFCFHQSKLRQRWQENRHENAVLDSLWEQIYFWLWQPFFRIVLFVSRFISVSGINNFEFQSWYAELSEKKNNLRYGDTGLNRIFFFC